MQIWSFSFCAVVQVSMQQASITVAEDAGEVNVCAVQSNQAVQGFSFTFSDPPGTAQSNVHLSYTHLLKQVQCNINIVDTIDTSHILLHVKVSSVSRLIKAVTHYCWIRKLAIVEKCFFI